MPITRRAMLGLLSASTFSLHASLQAAQPRLTPGDGYALRFPQGVASADPQPDAIVLWTRAEPTKDSDQVQVLVQVSEDADFSKVVVESQLETGAASDYTVRSYVSGLVPDTRYYYRFLGPDKSQSRLGRTRTAPAPGQDKAVNLAFVSCQSFENGYYGAWARMLADDKATAEDEQIQFILQLGDFIYERSWHKRYDGSAQSRYVPPFPDGVQSEKTRYAVSLADYRHLYKTYLGDPHLQEARARWPFIATWDDHEFSNNNFQSYATYGHSPSLAAARKMDANQAWFEYVPAALNESFSGTGRDFQSGQLTGREDQDNITGIDSLRIFRSLRWGKHIDLLITDCRSYRSAPRVSHQLVEQLGLPLSTLELMEILDYGREYAGGAPPEMLPYGDGDIPNPARNLQPGSCLGREQRDWFLSSLEASTATWKIWGNSIPLMPMNVDLSAIPMSDYQDSLPSADAWAGFPHESALIMQSLRDNNVSGLVSLAGDHHLHGAATVGGRENEASVAVDFACAGISSTPFFESLLDRTKSIGEQFTQMAYQDEGSERVPIWNMTMLQGVIASVAYARTGMTGVASWLGPNKANKGLKFYDARANGYGLVRFDAAEAQVELVAMSDLTREFKEPPETLYRAKFRLPNWSPDEGPELEGPSFEGAPPFPFTG